MADNKSIISIHSYQLAFSSLQLKKWVLTNSMLKMALKDKSQEHLFSRMQSTPLAVLEAFSHVTRSLSAVGCNEKSNFTGSQ